MAVTYRFEAPDRFVVGAIGEPEDRTFALQVREGRRLLTMNCEEAQVEALASYLDQVLAEIERLAHGIIEIPSEDDVLADLDPLDVPLTNDFSIGTMAIGWDGAQQAIRLDLYSEAGGPPVAPDPDLSGEEMAAREADRAAELASIVLQPLAGRAFVVRARAVLSAGLPACPMCAQPIRPEGHVCPRRNGYLGRDAWSGDVGWSH